MVVAQGNKIGTLYMTSSYRDMVSIVDGNAIQIHNIAGSNTWVKNEWNYSYQMINCQGWNLLSTNCARVAFSENRKW